MKNTSPDRVAIEEGVIVGNGGGRPLKCDVYTPPAGTANGASVLLIHGGTWVSGDRTQLRGYGIFLGRVGYTCVACEYRLAGDAKWPAQLDDVRTAFHWMHANADELDIDPNNIAVSGNSAGGHLSLMLAATAGLSGDPRVAACIAVYPPTDLTLRAPVNERLASALAERGSDFVDPSAYLLGGSDPQLRAQASPIHYPASSFPPTLLIHGNADEVVHVENSLRMYRALVDAGTKAELHIFEGAAHAFDREPAFGRQCVSLMALFLSRHVSPAPTGAK